MGSCGTNLRVCKAVVANDAIGDANQAPLLTIPPPIEPRDLPLTTTLVDFIGEVGKREAAYAGYEDPDATLAHRLIP